MRKIKIPILLISLLIATGMTVFVSVSEAVLSGDEKPIIVCTTTILASFVEQVGGNYVRVISIVPPGVCPAHYDITPSDIYAVSTARLVIYSGIEPWLNDLIEATGVNVTTIKIGGPWHPYTNALTYVSRIKDALSTVMPEYSRYFEENAKAVSAEIEATAKEILTNATELEVEKVKVVCMLWQKGFVEWMGFNIVAIYKPPEKMSLNEILNLTSKAENEKVALVIDNLPSGYTFGAKLAADVGAQHVVLTNFPGAVPGTETYAKMIEYNAKQLFEAVKRHRLIEGEIIELTEALKGYQLMQEEVEKLRDALGNANMQLKILSVTTTIFLAITIVEAVIIYRGKSR